MELIEATTHGIECLEKGGILLYPTDTAYGLGVDAQNESALRKLFELKARGQGKAVLVMVADMDMAGKYVVVDERARRLADKFLPGALTLVLPHRGNVPALLTGGKASLGIRIPDNEYGNGTAYRARRRHTRTGDS